MSEPHSARLPDREDKRSFLQKLAEFIHPGPDSKDELIETLADAEDNQIIGAAIQSAVSSVTPGVPNVVEGWATVSGTAAFESRTVGTHYIRLEVLGCSTAMYRWPAMTITRINK